VTSPPVIDALAAGAITLADVGPAAIAALTGVPHRLSLPPARSVVVLLVDGLGWQQLRRSASTAPTLAAMAGGPIAAGFPSTTASSLAALGTGLRTGGHGITGYTSRVGDRTEPINWLSWRTAGGGVDLRDELVPEQVQPAPTVWERAEQAGLTVTLATSAAFGGSGLTRAVLRGGTFTGTHGAADTVALAAQAASDRSLVYCYFSELDLMGHVRGTGSDSWHDQLALVDRSVALLRDRLPDDATLVVTADHGMVDVLPEELVDHDESPFLREDVAVLAGEARTRYVHAEPGTAAAVAQRWRAELPDGYLVLTRAEAIATGWYGPVESDEIAARIGDLVVVATGRGGIVRGRAEPRLSRMRGQHGSITPDELLVPLLIG
jgi:hypothetical protein